MKQIVLYIASSLDGFIADTKNSIDWLTSYKGNYGYNEFLQSVDIVFIGRKTYDEVCRMGVPNPHPEQMNYVFTKTTHQYTNTENIHFTSDDPIALARKIQTRDGKNIFLVGGGSLITTFLENDMIDEIIQFIVPVVLGGGTPLFTTISHTVAFSTVSARTYDDGMIELRLKKK